MTASQPVRFEVAGDVVRVILDRPPLNILTIAMMERFNAGLAEIAGRPGLKAVLLAAEGRAFSAGLAIEEHQADQVKPMLATFHQMFRQLHALPCPTVAAVQGPALGGGAELATFCDLVIASETATVGQPEIKVGVFPPIAALHYPSRVGPARALQLILSGRVLPARDAERMGLVDRVVPAGELDEAVGAAIAEFTTKSAAVLGIAKRAVRLGRDEGFEEALARLEALYLDELMATDDAAEGLRAFLEKRTPAWTDR
jgi:cyclohexa-1,5-dienecarbonyl-CoA hydratase